MKPYKVLIFILLVFLALGLIGWFFPRDGIHSVVHLKFIHPESLLHPDTAKPVKLDDHLNNMYKFFKHGIISNVEDSMQMYKDFHQNSPTAIHYPDNDWSYFDRFFESLDSAKQRKEVVRIIHYGDSQIEGDRISGFLREELQEHFGGLGFGMIPAIQIIPALSVYQSYHGAMTRYALWGEEVPRVSHRRYGLMAQMIMVYEQGGISVNKTKRSYELGSQFNSVKLIFGHSHGAFSASLTAGGRSYGEQRVNDSIRGIRIFHWTLEDSVSKASLNMYGTAEIYGIAFDGAYGVTVDNVPMRGSAGTIFSRMDKNHLKQSYESMNTRMIILQYGGNVMPAVNGMKSIDWYCSNIEKEILFLQEANPEAVILFIGPSDMSRNIDGTMKTWPWLKELNASLKETALKNGIAYWDMFQAMGGENSMPQWVKSFPPLASTDYIHFTLTGSQTIADMLYQSLMNDYNAYTLRKKIEGLRQDTLFKKPI